MFKKAELICYMNSGLELKESVNLSDLVPEYNKEAKTKLDENKSEYSKDEAKSLVLGIEQTILNSFINKLNGYIVFGELRLRANDISGYRFVFS